MLSSVSRLAGLLSDLRLVPKLSVQSPVLVSVSHLRTGASNTDTVNNRAAAKAEPEELPEGQSIVKQDSEMRREVMDSINAQLDSDPGRLFAVVHVRGHQHKVTNGEKGLIHQNSSSLNYFRRLTHDQNRPRSPSWI